MKIYIIALLVLIFTCKKNSKINILDKNEHIYQEIDDQENMLLNIDVAINQFGTPIEQQKLLLDNMYGEFYVSIYYKYSEKERQSKSIFIEEITWEKDDKNNITIWYEHLNKVLKPKAFLIWPKESEF